MQKEQIESYILVIVQFVCIVFELLLWSQSVFYFVGAAPLTLVPVVLITIGIAIGLWAMLTMRMGNFTVSPIPKKEARLVMNGPYGFVRHPMYLAVLAAMLGIAINIGSLLGYAVWLILLVDLIFKMRFEEKMLLEKFPEHEDYFKKTKKVLPRIW